MRVRITDVENNHYEFESDQTDIVWVVDSISNSREFFQFDLITQNGTQTMFLATSKILKIREIGEEELERRGQKKNRANRQSAF